MKKVLKWISIVFFSIYVIGCAALYFAQDRIIFNPQKIGEDTQFRFGREIKIPVDEDVSLHGLLHEINNPKGVVLYLHGNKGNARRCQRQAEMFSGFDHDVLLLDYRGYGKSDGAVTSMKQLYDDVQIVYNFLIEKYGEANITIAGYSLGTGMASYLAANNKPERLIMIAPYISIMDLKDRILPIIPDFLVEYKLDNGSHLKDVSCPVSIFHGTEDEVIPYDSAEELKRTFPEKVELMTLHETGHRRAIFHNSIRTWLANNLK